MLQEFLSPNFSTMAWKCLFCPSFTALWLVTLLTHLNSEHKIEKHPPICCGINGCSKEYTKINSLTKHIRTSHYSYLHCTSSEQTGGSPILLRIQPGWDQGSTYEIQIENSNGSTEAQTPYPSSECSDMNIQGQDSLAYLEPLNTLSRKYLCKIKGTNRLSGSATRKIAEATNTLVQQVICTLQQNIENKVQETNQNTEFEIQKIFQNASEEIGNVFSTPLSDTFSDPLNAAEEEILPEQIEPVKYVLGTRRALVKHGTKKRIAEVEDVFYYIPILHTIQVQLNCPKILDLVLKGPKRTSNSDIMEDFCDGTFFQNHELFSIDDHALAVLLYYDDVNFVNPLTNKHHKLSLFYYQLANLDPPHRSKLKSIHLFAICKSEHLSNPNYGFNQIIKPVVQDFKKLGSERGQMFQIRNGNVCLRGAILAFLADTPASNKAGGFKEGVGLAWKKCRHCMADFDSMQNNFLEEDFHLRNLEEHEEYLSEIETSPSMNLRHLFSKWYGINSRTELLNAPYFDPCEQLIEDVMHIFLEGVLAYELKLMLNFHIYEEGTFTLKELNDKIKSFPHGYSNCKNKPSVIMEKDLAKDASTNLGQTASQMWNLCHIFPIITSEIGVDTNDERWECIISLIELLSLTLAHKITFSSVVYMRRVIKHHMELFKKLYGDVANIIPKQHYLIHLPSLILKFGPLRRSWCMRFEGKHAFYKGEANAIKNFKNLPLSLSKRYLSSLYADHINLGHADVGPLFMKDSIFGRAKKLHGNEKQSVVNTIERFYGLGILQGKDLYSLDSAEIQGICYKPSKNAFVHLSFYNSLPEFGRIAKIWFSPHLDVFLALEVIQTLSYDKSLNAFKFEENHLPQGYQVTKPSDLESPFVYHSYQSYILIKINPFAWH